MKAPTLLRRHAVEWAFIGAVSLATLLTACGGGGSGPDGSFVPTAAAKPIPECSMALWGDSIAAASYVTGYLPESMVQGFIRLRPKYAVEDHTESGMTAVGKLKTFMDTPVTSHVVVIEYGMNDAVATDEASYKGALTEMVNKVQQAGSHPIISGLSQVEPGARPERDAFNQYAFEVALQTGAAWGYWDHVAYANGDNHDPLHPAQAYSTRLVEALVRAADGVNPGCAQ